MGIILTILFPIESDRPDRTDLVFVVAECWYKWDENIRSHLLLPGTHLKRFWRFSGVQWWSFFCSTPGGGQTNNDLKEEQEQEQKEKMKKCSNLSQHWPALHCTARHWQWQNWQPPSFVMTISFHCWNYCI